MLGKIFKLFALLIVLSVASAVGFYYLENMRTENEKLTTEIQRLQKAEVNLTQEKEGLIGQNSETAAALANQEKNISSLYKKLSKVCTEETCLFSDPPGEFRAMYGYVRLQGYYLGVGATINGVFNNCPMFVVLNAPDEFKTEAEFDAVHGDSMIFEYATGTLKFAFDMSALSDVQIKVLQKSTDKKPVTLSLVTDEQVSLLKKDDCRTYLKGVGVK